MLAAIDAGSNTLRLLIGRVADGKVVPEYYLRRICRLAGGYSRSEGLSPEARQRTLFALQEFAAVCRQFKAVKIRAVGTAAFRQAVNGEEFVREVRSATGLPLEIISGDMEARHMAAGVLCALDPVPAHALILDIGGGSTEFVLCSGGKLTWSRSLPLGVVRLIEDHATPGARQTAIAVMLTALQAELVDICNSLRLDPAALVLVGTAGTVTTLAALDMQMTEYDWKRVNNSTLSLARLHDWQTRLLPLKPAEREALPGMEAGRGDLIMPGLEIMLCLMRQMPVDSMIISDFGILEGLLLALQNNANT